jgi:hypothetical protein
LEPTRIEAHPDSEGYVAVFPFPHPTIRTARELSAQVFGLASGIAVATPFGSGRWTNPDAWYATFRLMKES